MNRQTKRMLQRQGQLAADGSPAAAPRQERQPATRQRAERVGPRTFIRQVVAELRRVAWPSRREVVRLSGIVLVALALVTGLVFGLDYAFGKGVLFLYDA